jgi:hypothetical protein
MYIPLSFMGGSGTGASCYCKKYKFTALTTGSTVTYTPCNSEVVVAESIASGSSITACVSNWQSINYIGNISSSVSTTQGEEYCVNTNCPTCDGYRYYLADLGSGRTFYYIPCGATSSALVAKTFTPGEKVALCIAYPQTMYISGGFKMDRMSGYLGRCVDTGSVCNSPAIPLIGDFVSGGVIAWLTGSSSTNFYSTALISTTQSLADSSLSSSFARFGYYGTQTNIVSKTDGITNTAALANYTPTTASIAANVVYNKNINGFTDWYLPAQNEGLGVWTPAMWNQPSDVRLDQLFEVDGGWRTIAQYFRFTLNTINVTSMNIITSTESGDNIPINSPFIQSRVIASGDDPTAADTKIGKNDSGSVVPFRKVNI